MHIAPALCIVLIITAWYGPVLADEPSDIDALIIAGLDNKTVTDEIERVLQDEDTLLGFSLADEEIAGVSHSTYERIKQTYATPARVTNLMNPHLKRDSVVDLSFKGMPYESETWLIQLIVVVVVTVILILAQVAAPYITAWYMHGQDVASYIAEAAESAAKGAAKTTHLITEGGGGWGKAEEIMALVNEASRAARTAKTPLDAWQSALSVWKYAKTTAAKLGDRALMNSAISQIKWLKGCMWWSGYDSFLDYGSFSGSGSVLGV